MQVVVNGAPAEVASGETIAGLLERLAIPLDRVAVERNRTLVPRRLWAMTVLCEQDSLEVVQFVGGGRN